jgi:hypothetical protein
VAKVIVVKTVAAKGVKVVAAKGVKVVAAKGVRAVAAKGVKAATAKAAPVKVAKGAVAKEVVARVGRLTAIRLMTAIQFVLTPQRIFLSRVAMPRVAARWGPNWRVI